MNGTTTSLNKVGELFESNSLHTSRMFLMSLGERVCVIISKSSTGTTPGGHEVRGDFERVPAEGVGFLPRILTDGGARFVAGA